MVDPRVYVVLTVDFNDAVDYSTTHIFGFEGEILTTRVRHGNAERNPFEELAACLDWGESRLYELYEDGVVKPNG